MIKDKRNKNRTTSRKKQPAAVKIQPGMTIAMKMKNTDNTADIVKITTILTKLDKTKLLLVNYVADTLAAVQRIEDEESKEKSIG